MSRASKIKGPKLLVRCSAMIVPPESVEIAGEFSVQCALFPNRLRNFTHTLNDEFESWVTGLIVPLT
jgi:hypothetical protein